MTHSEKIIIFKNISSSARSFAKVSTLINLMEVNWKITARLRSSKMLLGIELESKINFSNALSRGLHDHQSSLSSAMCLNNCLQLNVRILALISLHQLRKQCDNAHPWGDKNGIIVTKNCVLIYFVSHSVSVFLDDISLIIMHIWFKHSTAVICVTHDSKFIKLFSEEEYHRAI